jgi:RNA polymerase sigma-B factor
MITTHASATTRNREERRLRTRELLERAHSTDDPMVRDDLLGQVVLVNRGVADAIANRFRNRGIPLDDLRQAAYEGLIKAVRRFDPSVRPDLLTYAVPTIRGEIQRWFRDQGWTVRPPRRLQELQWRVNRSIERLSQELGRDPSHREISTDLDAPESEVVEAVQGFGCFQPASLDQPARDDDGASLGDLVAGEEDTEVSQVEARAVLAPVLRRLSERDRRMLYLRYFQDQSQGQIGQELGITQVQVSRQLHRIFRDVRRELA